MNLSALIRKLGDEDQSRDRPAKLDSWRWSLIECHEFVQFARDHCNIDTSTCKVLRDAGCVPDQRQVSTLVNAMRQNILHARLSSSNGDYRFPIRVLDRWNIIVFCLLNDAFPSVRNDILHLSPRAARMNNSTFEPSLLSVLRRETPSKQGLLTA